FRGRSPDKSESGRPVYPDPHVDRKKAGSVESALCARWRGEYNRAVASPKATADRAKSTEVRPLPIARLSAALSSDGGRRCQRSRGSLESSSACLPSLRRLTTD